MLSAKYEVLKFNDGQVVAYGRLECVCFWCCKDSTWKEVKERFSSDSKMSNVELKNDALCSIFMSV